MNDNGATLTGFSVTSNIYEEREKRDYEGMEQIY